MIETYSYIARVALLSLSCVSWTAGCLYEPSAAVDDSISHDEQSIIGGVTDNGDPAVVAVYRHPAGVVTGTICTGTVISPRFVLTAAHCVPPNTGQVFEVLTGTGLNIGVSPSLAVANTFFDPAYNFSNPSAGHDLGLIQLAAATTLPPAWINRGPLGNTAVRIVGYGATAGNGTGTGVKRQATTGIVNQTDLLVGIGDTGMQACFGDSGGPAFQTIGNVEMIIGTTSFGISNCTGGAWYSRVDALTSFIDAHVPLPSQHIVFRSSEDHLHELYNNGVFWNNNDLTPTGDRPTGDPSGYILADTQHIVFRSANNHLHELYNNGSFWSNNDLTPTGVGPAGDPAGYSLDITQHIVFRGTDGHVHELYNNGSFWNNNDLTAGVGGLGPAGDVSGYILGNTQHIVFRGTEGHVHELYNNGSFWSNNDLTQSGIGPAGDVSGYILGNTQHIVFRGTDGHVHELYNNGSFWSNNDLTAGVGGDAPANDASGDPAGYTVGTTQHIVFRSADGHVHELFNNGVFWNNNDLTATGIGSVSAVTGYSMM